VVQAVGQRIETYFDRPWRDGEERTTRLVVIGLHDIDQAAIAGAIAASAG
jgi:cobalamin biosynthesis protein CobW